MNFWRQVWTLLCGNYKSFSFYEVQITLKVNWNCTKLNLFQCSSLTSHQLLNGFSHCKHSALNFKADQPYWTQLLRNSALIGVTYIPLSHKLWLLAYTIKYFFSKQTFLVLTCTDTLVTLFFAIGNAIFNVKWAKHCSTLFKDCQKGRKNGQVCLT